ncbi:DUF2280 domain-containing protein [Methylobacterium komagatae]|uniref:DUF2280 domain-containing protein n=1 Tax=Methylobacterium komagatae TaxID=374425 RepID=A0ABW2BJJ8_9HYPH
MNVLSDDVKTYIVQQLAMFEPPSAVVKAVKQEFDLDVSPQQVEAYDPGKRASRNLSDAYREIFEATRNTFLTDTAAIGVSHKVVRLRTLARLIETAEKRGNAVLAANLLVQVAKEMGEAYTNRQRIDANVAVRSHEDALGDLE